MPFWKLKLDCTPEMINLRHAVIMHYVETNPREIALRDEAMKRDPANFREPADPVSYTHLTLPTIRLV